MQQKVYWHTTVDMPDGKPQASIPEKVDAAVVGAGYTGLSAARTLAKKGVKVVVLEAETAGWGASSRNGGMVLTGLKLPMQTILKRYGREAARRLFQCSLESIDCVEEIIREEGMDCGFARTGHLLTANKPSHFEAMKEEADFLGREFGHTVDLIPPARMAEEVGTRGYHGALLDRVSAGLNPARYAAGLARAAANAGAVICTQARVENIRRMEAPKRGQGFFIQTERGTITAEKVLVSTSGYTGKATPALSRKIVPIGSFIIATEQLPESLARELIPNQRMVFDYRHFLNYFRLWDRRMIFGGRAAFFPETPNTVRESAEILRREMVKLFPLLKDAAVEYAWGGTLDFAYDMMPHVGEMDGFAYSLGYAGHGVAMATYLGKTLSEAMLNGNMEKHPFAAYGFPSLPLGISGQTPWFLPLAGIWYRILDWLE